MLRVLNCFLVITFLATLPALARDEAPARVGRAASSRATSQSTCRTTKERSAAAAVNYPVATGTSLWTDPDARAEIRIGPNTTRSASPRPISFLRT
jgi:hypothetical protein